MKNILIFNFFYYLCMSLGILDIDTWHETHIITVITDSYECFCPARYKLGEGIA